MRKIVQISISESNEDNTQWALCNDGSVWMYQWPKAIYKDITPTLEKPYQSREKIGMAPATWERMADIPKDAGFNI
jgi:hypothetical protein